MSFLMTAAAAATPPDRWGYVTAAYGSFAVLLVLYGAIQAWRVSRLKNHGVAK